MLAHTLPDALGVTASRWAPAARYDAILECHTPYGLEWTTELDIPASHALARVLRIDRLIARLEVEAPEEGGWLNKEVRNRPQRLDRLYLTALSVHPSETAVRLRSAQDGTGAGFDILIQNEPSRVAAREDPRGRRGGATPSTTWWATTPRSCTRSATASSPWPASSPITRSPFARRAWAVRPSRASPSPRVLVDQILASIAPTVHEIAKRSLAPGELVIKRLVGDSRREEVFVSKKELRQKVEPLPAELRAAFDPLELWDALAQGDRGARSGPPPEPPPPPPKAIAARPIQTISSPPRRIRRSRSKRSCSSRIPTCRRRLRGSDDQARPRPRWHTAAHAHPRRAGQLQGIASAQSPAPPSSAA